MAAGTEPHVWAVVLAAGRGERFGRPKQFERVDGIRLVDRAVDIVRPHVDGIVLALPPGMSWDGPTVEVVVDGGATHAESTSVALAALPAEADTVLITAPSHPLIDASLIADVLGEIHRGADASVPLLPLADAVKVHDATGVHSVFTSTRPSQAQLPFGFRRSVLDEATTRWPDFVEELEAVERLGGTITAVDGRPTNIHVATPADLALATLILRHG